MSALEQYETCACGGSCGCRSESLDMVELSKDAYIQRLEAYLKDLRAEIVTVERELDQLRQVA